MNLWSINMFLFVQEFYFYIKYIIIVWNYDKYWYNNIFISNLFFFIKSY